MSAEHDEALSILRAVWRSQDQDGDGLADALGEGKTCKKMADVGFDDYAGGEADRSAAWRATLEREGKLRPSAGSVKDLVFGSQAS